MDIALSIDIMDDMFEAVYFVDVNRIIKYWNKAAEKLTGFSKEEVIGRSCRDSILTHVDSNGTEMCIEACPLAKCICDKKYREAELFLHHKNGYRIPVAIRITPILDDSGDVLGALEVFTDISNKNNNEEKMHNVEDLVCLDCLTKLPKRKYLENEIERSIWEYNQSNTSFGVFFIGVDDFSILSNKYGRDTGDDILKFIANNFKTNCRPLDCFGRWGEEEFIGIVKNISHDNFLTYGNRIRQLVEYSYLIKDNEKITATISIGGTMINKKDSINTIVERAERLLYSNKGNWKNQLTLG